MKKMKLAMVSKTPLKAIRAKCVDCSGGQLKQARRCSFEGCPMHSLRMGRGGRATLMPIKAFCIWCCAGQRHEVKLCPAVKCPLWEYRFGKRPKKDSGLQKKVTREHISQDKYVGGKEIYIATSLAMETALSKRFLGGWNAKKR